MTDPVRSAPPAHPRRGLPNPRTPRGRTLEQLRHWCALCGTDNDPTHDHVWVDAVTVTRKGLEPTPRGKTLAQLYHRFTAGDLTGFDRNRTHMPDIPLWAHFLELAWADGGTNPHPRDTPAEPLVAPCTSIEQASEAIGPLADWVYASSHDELGVHVCEMRRLKGDLTLERALRSHRRSTTGR